MKNYILWIVTGVFCVLCIYYAVVWWMDEEYEYTEVTSTEDTVSLPLIIPVEQRNASAHYDIPNLPDSLLVTWILKDISDEVDWQNSLYQPLDKLSLIYSLGSSQNSIWILHQTVLIKFHWSWWFVPWFTIHDAGKECHTWNRPTWFVQQGNKLLMSVLDKCGGGSMEWFISSYELQQDGKRELAGCYNYANRDPFQELAPEVYKDKRYEWGTTQLDKLPVEPLSTCEWNIQIQYYM